MRRNVLPALLVIVGVVLGFLGYRSGTSDAAASGRTAAGTTTPVLSARRVPAWLAQPGADAKLRDAMDQVIADSPDDTCLEVSLAGRVIYQHDQDEPLTPASTEKLVTGSVFLDLLGKDFHYRTTVVGAKPDGSGTVAGDLYLKGGGDPILAIQAYADHFEIHSKIHTPLEALADAVAKAGVKRITGRLLGDESRYDSDRYVDAWPQRYADQNQSGPLTALTVNDGFTSWPPSDLPGAAEEEVAPDPPAYAAEQLANLLRARGITIDGGTGAGQAPAGTEEVAGVDSPPMAKLIEELLTGSDNQTAELMVKELGVQKGSGGSTAAGMQVVNDAIARLGLDRPGSKATDGSGLDEANKVTCAMLTGLLDRSGRDGIIGEGLAVSGKSGTLSTRFTDDDVKGRIRAKTGTLNTVTALAGFVDAKQGPSLTFAYIASGRTVTNSLLEVQDQLGKDLVQYPQGPTLAQLGPQ